jgi:hypothetical protein
MFLVFGSWFLVRCLRFAVCGLRGRLGLRMVRRVRMGCVNDGGMWGWGSTEECGQGNGKMGGPRISRRARMGEGGKCRRGRVGGGLICLRFATPFGQPKAGYLPSVGSRSDDGYFGGGTWWDDEWTTNFAKGANGGGRGRGRGRLGDLGGNRGLWWGGEMGRVWG